MNKKISSPIALIILITLVILIGGLIIWQSFKVVEGEILSPEENQNQSKIIEDKTTNWKTYRNEEYGFEFKYPIDWGEITFKYHRSNKSYNLSSEDIEIWYHEPSGILAFIIEGIEKVTLSSGEGNFDNYQDILKVIYPDKKIKTIYTVSPENLQWYTSIDRELNFSPNGEYIYFIEVAWESDKSFLINIATGRNILKDYNIRFLNIYEDVYWSPSGGILAIRSHLNLMAGGGADGIFISDYGKPERLNEVLSMTSAETDGGSYFYDLYFIDNDNFSFSMFSREYDYDSEESDYYKEERRIYKYNVKTKELEEIK